MFDLSPKFIWRKMPKVKYDFPAIIYLFKINNRNKRKRAEICSKLIKTPERRQ